MKTHVKTDKIFVAMISFFLIMGAYFYSIGGAPITFGMGVLFTLVSLLYLACQNLDAVYDFLKRNNLI
jgi:hypothetical protein